MLKRIEANQARAGMYVEVIEGAWDDNPLQQRRFLLSSAAVRTLKAGKVSGIIINTAKGIDVISSKCDGLASDESNSECLRMDASSALEILQKSTARLNDMFADVATGGEISFDDTASIADQISKSVDLNPSVFISVTRLKSKDETTFVHSVAVSALMIHFGRYLGLDAATVQLLGVAGLLHDVGKVDVPDDILSKRGPLTEAETRVMRGHPALGHQILLRQAGMPEMVLDICLHHHERIDGKGYPDNLSGADFSLFSRLSAICDVYDAITSIRPYRKPWSASEALSWMMRREGHFDQKLLRKFTLCMSVTLPRSF